MRILFFIIPIFLFACGTTSRIQRYAQQQVLNDSALLTAHVGISVYEPATGKYLYNYQGDKYFVPASNTKLPTCYAAMKYLGDSLVGLRYGVPDSGMFRNQLLVVQPNGDPTFLHQDFKTQSVFDFLKKELIENDRRVAVFPITWRDEIWGSGWSWTDFDAAYMAERNSFPSYGNIVEIKTHDSLFADGWRSKLRVTPSIFSAQINRQWVLNSYGRKLSVHRRINENIFFFEDALDSFRTLKIPFKTLYSQTTFEILDNLLGKKLFANNSTALWDREKNRFVYVRNGACDVDWMYIRKWHTIHSQPTDSLLRPMMHRSDNFFAEQSLLMVSNEHLQYMSDAAIIDTLLKTDFKNLPQKPRWADGSGLSRYNLFTPQDFVFILNKMKTDFGMARIKDILPTRGEGTLSSYYVSDSSFIYAKTGTLSGVVALSGFLYTQKGRELIFSILVNNHKGSATAVRRAVERFVKQLRKDL